MVGLYIKYLDPQCLLVITELVLLKNLEFDSLIRLGNWFDCLLLLMQIRPKRAELRKQREIWDSVTF